MRSYDKMMNFRHPLRAGALLGALILSTIFSAAAGTDRPGGYLFYVGTYTEEGSKSKGIYAYRYDATTSEITPLGLAAETTNPSWVTLHPNGRFLYAVNGVGNYKGPNSGGVSAFSVDHATGKLTFLNEVASHGADPCYIIVDKAGKYVLVANYTRTRSISHRTTASPWSMISASTSCWSTNSTVARDRSPQIIHRSRSSMPERAHATSCFGLTESSPTLWPKWGTP
jgi:6-phosphogluconolactonase (cycloisomerase 2 family)